MRATRSSVSLLVVLVSLVGAGGCALRAPAFVAELPDAVPDDTKTIAVIGDLQLTSALVRFTRGREDNREQQRILVDDLAARSDEYDALVIVGDLVYSARSGKDWKHLDSLIAPIAATHPVLPAIGNHDYYCFFYQLCWAGVVPRRFRVRFPWISPGMPYLVPWGKAVMIFLDSETALESQSRWLATQLAAAGANYEAALVFFHRPPFTNSIDKGAHDDEEIQRLVIPVLESAPVVTAVFNGHVHGYEHQIVNGVHYFTIAGGGGPRGFVGADRSSDVYRGRDCVTEESGAVLRPYNYATVKLAEGALEVDVSGFCRGDDEIGLLESVTIPLDRG